MSQPQIASIRYRVLALAINLAIGTLPLSAPSIISTYNMADSAWIKHDNIREIIGLILGLGQILFVHKMQGSPGAVFAGLRVQYICGSPPTLRTTLLRGLPYLTVLVAAILIPHTVNNKKYMEFLSIVILSAAAFIVGSGVTMIISGRDSIIDRITGTRVIKAHRINV